MVKRDAERVLERAYTSFGLRGKIGVYGRSIGGIAACHLAQKYADLVEVMIIDRSLAELQQVAESKLRGDYSTIAMMKAFVNGWSCHNPQNYTNADKAYKIICCDPYDDTVDMFCSTMAGVARC